MSEQTIRTKYGIPFESDEEYESVDVDLAQREAAREAAYHASKRDGHESLFRTSEGDSTAHNPARPPTVVQASGGKIRTDFQTLHDLQKECWQIAEDHGWHDEPATFGDRIALIHSEASEALEDFRDGHAVDEVWYESKLGDKALKPCGVPTELSDVIIRVLDLAEIYDIDLVAAMVEKMEYNKTRPYRHGGKKI